MADLPPLGNAPLKQCPPVDPVLPGFRGAGVPCGLRKDGRADLALIAAERAVPTAAVFTTNRLPAAPVIVSRQRARSGYVRAVLANSGGANAATGQAGLDACLATTAALAKALDCPEDQILACSTGVIGLVLDAAKVAAALPALVGALSPDGLAEAAGAVMTTDAFRKMSRATATVHGKTVSVLGMAKGAGMIRPDMATMLAFILTDAAAAPAALDRALRAAVEMSFNRASVDGDTSTNDTAILMASGAAGNPELTPDDPELAAFTTALTQVCQELATMMVADGEGADYLIRVRVTGADNREQARHLCYAIAHSPLVKTAMAAADPNWGRILSAAASESARRGLAFVPENIRLWIGPALIADGAVWTGRDAEDQAAQAMKGPRYEVRLDLGQGEADFWVLTSDLNHAYVDENMGYRS